MNKELWNKCIEFHGHQCPGLAIGYRASGIAKEKLSLNFSQDEEIVCITENDACGVDAVQFITGCTLGKGNLIFKDTGKMAFTFINRKNGDAIRLMLKYHDRDMESEKRKRYILEAPEDDVFKIEYVSVRLPARARRFPTVICEECNEGAPEHKIRLQEGKKLCLGCFSEYSRGW